MKGGSVLTINRYFSGIINSTKEKVMKEAQRAWINMNDLKAVTTEEFFKITFGFSYDKGNTNHDAHYKNLQNFLGGRVGVDAYVDNKIYSPAMAVIKKKSLKHMTTFDKMFHIWNNNVGAKIRVSGFVELIKRTFDSNVHKTQVSLFVKYVIKFPELGTSKKQKGRGEPFLYSIHQKIPKDLYDDIVMDQRKLQNNYRASFNQKKQKDVSKPVKVLKNEDIHFAIFTERHFQTIGGETFAKISKDQAMKANEIVHKLLTTLKDVKTELAEVLDENQTLQTKLKICQGGVTSSIGDRLKELEEKI